MRKETTKYIIGPELTVFGSNPLKQIKRAVKKLNIDHKLLEVGWVDQSIKPTFKTFHFLIKDLDDLELIPLNFAETIQDTLKANPPEN